MRALLTLTGCALALGLTLRSHVAHVPAPVRQQNPLLSLERNRDGPAVVVGQVEEQLAAGSYTYLRVRTTAGAQLWTVTLGAGAPVGAQVRVRSFGQRERFYSQRLQREFPLLVFGIVTR